MLVFLAILRPNLHRQLSLDKLAATGFPVKCSIFGDDFTPADGDDRPAGDFEAGVGGPIDIFMEDIGAESELFVGIKHHQIGIITDGNDAFASQAKEPGWIGTAHSDPALEGEAVRQNAVSVHQRKAALDGGHAAGDAAEVVEAQGFVGAAKRAVIGGDDL